MIKKKKDLVKWCKQTGNCCWFCPNYLTQRKILIRASTPTLSGICLKFCALKTDYLKWLYLKKNNVVWSIFAVNFVHIRLQSSFLLSEETSILNESWVLIFEMFYLYFCLYLFAFFFLLTLISVIVSPIL